MKAGKKQRLWVLMKVQSWDSLTVGGYYSLGQPADGPSGFLPVFCTKKEAVAFGGSAKHVKELLPGVDWSPVQGTIP